MCAYQGCRYAGQRLGESGAAARLQTSREEDIQVQIRSSIRTPQRLWQTQEAPRIKGRVTPCLISSDVASLNRVDDDHNKGRRATDIFFLNDAIGHASTTIFNLLHLLIVRLETKAMIDSLRPYPLRVTGQRVENDECEKCWKRGTTLGSSVFIQ